MEKKISDLQVGDEVIISHTFKKDCISTVERLTNTQIVVKGISCKFNRESGSEVGGDKWSRHRISIATEERINKIKDRYQSEVARKYVQKLYDYWDSLPMDARLKIGDVINHINHYVEDKLEDELNEYIKTTLNINNGKD